MNIRQASKEDLAEIEEILNASELPAEDCHAHLSNFFVAEDNGRIIGVGGLQICDATGLVRSIAVVPEQRRNGIGAKLYARIERRASKLGITDLYLLTESAGKYFENLGFTNTARSELPVPIMATKQYRTLCPASANPMYRKISGPNNA